MLPTLAQYQRHRRWIEVGGWGVLLLVNAVMNSLVVIADLRRAGDPLAAWQPVTWEFTSTLVTAMLIPVIVMFNAWLRPRTRWWQALLAHGLATVPFCLLHVGGMVLLREAVYALVGEDYAFAPWWRELGYEYLKDVRSYFLILALIELYALLLRRWQGEARMLTDDAQQPQPVTDRFLVKKLGREFWCAFRTSIGSRLRATTSPCMSAPPNTCCAKRWPVSNVDWLPGNSSACIAAPSST